MRVVFGEPARPDELDWWRRYLPDVSLAAPQTADADELLGLLSDAEVLLVRRLPVTERLVAAAPRMRLVLKIGRRTRSLDLAALDRAGVVVVAEPNPAWVAVAEHALLLMLALCRSLPSAHAAVIAGQVRAGLVPRPTTEREYAYNWADIAGLQVLFGRTLGLVGFGEIGRDVAARAAAFGMRVLYTARRPAKDVAPELAEYRPLRDLLAASDVVSLHVPHTAETEGLIGRPELALLRPHAMLVNTARGGIVDEAALVEALEQGRLAGAALDVFRAEPLPPGHPLIRLPNVVLTPHIGGVRIETMADPFPGFVRAVERHALARPGPG